jgi:molybdopterin biosynthesis enzyme
MQGLAPEATRHFAMSSSAPKRDSKKTLFLKARLTGPKLELLSGQQSHMLQSLALANALALVEPDGRGRLLEVKPL